MRLNKVKIILDTQLQSVLPTNPSPQDHFIDSHGPSYSCVSPVLCEYYDSHDHDTCNCPYRAYADATFASVEKKINELTDKMIENMKVRIAGYSQCFHQSRDTCNESDSSLGSHHSCEKVIEPSNLQFDDDIFSVEYESISCGFDVNVGLDVDLSAEYESFSFDPSKLTSFLKIASLNLLSLRALPIRNLL